VLEPDDLNTPFASFVDERADVGDDRVALMCIGHDALLDVDHQQGGVGPI